MTPLQVRQIIAVTLYQGESHSTRGKLLFTLWLIAMHCAAASAAAMVTITFFAADSILLKLTLAESKRLCRAYLLSNAFRLIIFLSSARSTRSQCRLWSSYYHATASSIIYAWCWVTNFSIQQHVKGNKMSVLLSSRPTEIMYCRCDVSFSADVSLTTAACRNY